MVKSSHPLGEAELQHFASGATRSGGHKIDYEAFIHPMVLYAYGQFMDFNRLLPDGSERAGDNWQCGIPRDSYAKSLVRHAFDVWLHHRSWGSHAKSTLVWALCAVIFNASGYLLSLIEDDPGVVRWARESETKARGF